MNEARVRGLATDGRGTSGQFWQSCPTGTPPPRPGLGHCLLLQIAVNNSIIHSSAPPPLADTRPKSYVCYLSDQFEYKCYNEFCNLVIVPVCVCVCVYFPFLGYENLLDL